MSFYDWYCDLPPSSPQVWGEQTDVPESADWYNSTLHHRLGLATCRRRARRTRTSSPRCATRARRPWRSRPTTPRSPSSRDIWLHPKQGTDAAVAMAMGHVILKEFYFPDGGERSAYFDDYVRRYTDMPMLVMLKEHTLPERRSRSWCPTATCARPTSTASSARPTIRNGRPSPSTRPARSCCRNGAIGFRWGPDGRADAGPVEPRGEGSAARRRGEAQAVAARRRARRATRPPRSASRTSAASRASISRTTSRADVLVRTVPVQRIALGKAARARGAGRHGVRPAGRELRRARGLAGELRREELRRRHALHAGLAGAHHRHAARAA